MKEKTAVRGRNPYANLPIDDLEQIALRSCRATADDLRVASNALKDLPYLRAETMKELDAVSGTAKRLKNEAGKRLK
jgi:hypothetical protein